MAHRRIGRWIAFLLLVVAGDRLLATALDAAVARSQIRFSRLYSGTMRAEVLALGNSRAVNAFYVPALREKLGTSVESLAYNGVTTPLAEALALDALDRGMKPRWALIEATVVQGDEGVINSFRMYRRRSRRLAELTAEHDPIGSMASDVSWLYALNTELALRAGYYLRRSDSDAINHYKLTPELLASVRSMDPIEFAIEPAKNEELAHLVSALRARGVRTCVVIAPLLPEYRGKIRNFDAWRRALEQALGGHGSLVDLSQALTEHEGFADRIHTNLDGAATLADIIADVLARDCKAPPSVPELGGQ